MSKFIIRYFLLVSLSVLLSGCAGIRVGFQKRVEKTTALDLVLNEIFLERQDLKIKRDISPRDPFLLNKVPYFLKSPVQIISFSEDVENAFRKESNRLSSLVKVCGDMLEIAVDEAELPETPEDFPAPSLGKVVKDIYTSLAFAKVLFEEAFAELSPDEIGFVKGRIEQLLLYGKHQENLTRKESQDLIEKAFLLASRIDIEKIGGACYCVASALDSAIPELKKEFLLQEKGGRVATPLGDIVISGNGDDTHDGDMPLILIDLGGDDTYSFQNHSRISVIIDVSGDDTYESSNSCVLGSGVLGMGFLVDMQGDDLYQGENFSFGCGFLGAGVVADLAGNDRYVSRMFCQGAATFGIGLLYDENGDDFYQSALYSQGMGYVAGAGVLVDVSGNDSFTSGSVVADSREKTGAFQTYSQGFGIGCRDFASGGVGILYNGEGNDTYKGSYFCQGSSYWRALGMLIDKKGDDQYAARRYSQGAGVHSSIGVLFDSLGNDVYTSWGVSQGCGHDFSVGVLHDRQGDDQYEAEWLSQGVGSSVGIGLFIDDKGDDTYKAGSTNTIQGSGAYDKRRDAESIGVLVDGEGKDVFSGDIEEKGVWRRGDIGGGIDSDGQLRSVWHEPPEGSFLRSGPEVSFQDNKKKEEDSWEKWLLPELEAPLFLEESWDRASESLAEKGPHIIPSLCKYLEIKDVSVHRAIEETFKKLGESYLEDVHDFLQSEDTSVREKRFLLYVLGEIADANSRGVFLNFLNHESSSIQAMALRGFYKLHEPPPFEVFEKLCASRSSAVRRYLCLALQSSDDVKALQLLCDMLADEDFQVRHAAYRVLKEKKQQALPFLKELKLKHGLLPSVYRMVDDIIKQ